MTITTDDPDYRPFPIDWRFLPEPVLLAKDCVRRPFMWLSGWAAREPVLSPFWKATAGRETLNTIRKARFLFIHIPKTAGTSISSLLYERNLPPYTAQFYRDVFGKELTGIPSFAVIRHPMDRLISGYNMAVNGGTDIIAYDRVESLFLKKMKSFSDYVDFIYVNRSRLNSLPAMVRNQASYIQDAQGRILVDRLFALDRTRGLPQELASWIGVQQFPHFNATVKHRAELSADDRDKILEVYEKDLELYQSLVSAAACESRSGGRRNDHSAGGLVRSA